MDLNNDKNLHRPQAEESFDKEFEINWKDVLASSLGVSVPEVSSQRSWSQLTGKMRSLCPETQWLFIREEVKDFNESAFVKSIQSWLEKLVALPEWPFPEKIFISAHSEQNQRYWQIYCLKTDGKLPFLSPPSNVTVFPWSDQYCHGWKIHAFSSFTSSKTGSA